MNVMPTASASAATSANYSAPPTDFTLGKRTRVLMGSANILPDGCQTPSKRANGPVDGGNSGSKAAADLLSAFSVSGQKSTEVTDPELMPDKAGGEG